MSVADVVLGEKIFIHMDTIMKVYRTLFVLAYKMDEAAAEKFPDMPRVDAHKPFEDTQMLDDLFKSGGTSG